MGRQVRMEAVDGLGESLVEIRYKLASAETPMDTRIVLRVSEQMIIQKYSFGGVLCALDLMDVSKRDYC